MRKSTRHDGGTARSDSRAQVLSHCSYVSCCPRCRSQTTAAGRSCRDAEWTRRPFTGGRSKALTEQSSANSWASDDVGKSKCQAPDTWPGRHLPSRAAPHHFHKACYFDSPSHKILASLEEACGCSYYQLKGQVPARVPTPGQSSREATQLSGLWRNMDPRTLAGIRGDKAARPLPAAPPSRPQASGGSREGTLRFPLLGHLCPHAHQWKLKDETSSPPRRGAEAVPRAQEIDALERLALYHSA